VSLSAGFAVLSAGRFREQAPNATGHGTTLYGFAGVLLRFD
jgi:hypothetical protein